jgi:glyoxylase-like metal-dependent hydrolase (beta-lactamase superfamily II)
VSSLDASSSFAIDVLSLERFRLDGGAMFGIVPKPLWEKSNPADEKNRIAMGCQCLLLRKHERVILVDAGMGTKWEPKGREIYAMEADAPDPAGHALAKHGLTAAQVTDVVITHLHFDHAGGLTHHNPETGELLPTFPNAKHWVQAVHLDWARSPTEKDRGSFPPENFEPLAKHDLLHLVRGQQSLLSGLEVIPLFGHTHGMQAVLIEGNPPIFYPADLLPMTAHLHLPFIMAYDIAPLTTLEEKKRLLARAVKEEWQVIFEHEPYETRGRVEMFHGKYRLGTA